MQRLWIAVLFIVGLGVMSARAWALDPLAAPPPDAGGAAPSSPTPKGPTSLPTDDVESDDAEPDDADDDEADDELHTDDRQGASKTPPVAVEREGKGRAAQPPPLLGRRIPTPSKLSAVKLDGADIHLDGVANEPVWQSAAYVTGMTSYDPVEGSTPVSEADVRFFYDDDALYVYARIYEQEGTVRGRYAAREVRANDDLFEIMLDTFHDRRTGYDFVVTSYGVQLDYTIVDDNWSSAWDGVWDSATQVYPDGYAVEVRLPFRTLRFPRASKMTWGIGFGVYTGNSKQYDKWPSISSTKGTLYAQLADLEDIEGISPAHDVDIIPSLVLSRTGNSDGTVAPGTPGGFAWNKPVPLRLRDPGIVDPGLDIRYGITSSTNLTVTLNPDFSQVEADTDQLSYNLRSPILLVEKRPFFLEGIDTFGPRVEAIGVPIPPPTPLLYTRSIVDPVAGLKITGREGPLAFGVLTAWDQLPIGSLVTPVPHGAPRALRRSGFEDATGADAVTSVGSVSMDVGVGSRVGVFFADKRLVHRATGKVDRNDVYSADTFLTFDQIYNVIARVSASNTLRNDREDVFAGGLYDLTLRRKDPHLLLEGRTSFYSDGFRAEMSPITRVNDRPSTMTVAYRFYTGLPAMSFVEPGVSGSTAFESTSGDLLDWSVIPSLTTRFGTNTDVKVTYSQGQETYVRSFTPLHVVSASVATNPLPWLEAKGELQAGDQIHYQVEDLYLGRLAQGMGTLVIQAFRRAELNLRYTKSMLWDPTRTLRENVDLYYAKVNVSIDQRTSLRAIAQLDTFNKTFSSSLLAAYQIYPGTEVYAGYLENDNAAGNARLSPSERRVFLKLSYRVQL